VKKYQEDGTLPIGKMGHKGRPPYAYPSDITSIAEYCDSQLGRTFNRTDISDMVHARHDERLIEAGIQPIARKSTDRRQIRCTAFAVQSNMSIAENVISKTNTRDAAENSLLAAVATLGVIGATHSLLLKERITILEWKHENIAIVNYEDGGSGITHI